MATEVVVGLIGFGTALVGLATAYLSRSRHVLHRHEFHEPEADDAADAECPAEDEAGTPAGATGGNKYALAAVRAVELCRAEGMTPPAAWERATVELFGAGTPSQKKVCPKEAFFGLCQAGYVVGVPGGSYGRGEKNKAYATAAAGLLAREPGLATDWAELWRRALGGVAKRHNSQMHVVIALWEKGLLSVPGDGLS